MKFSLNFIKEFFDPKMSADMIADKLTMSGLEVEYLEQVKGDWVFDIEVTTNRYDWMSMFGIAREIATVCGKKFDLALPEAKLVDKIDIDIKIENKKDCPVYIARLIKDVKVKQSPCWLTERVQNSGIKTINNVVDATNYCMLKWGTPLHAFDADKVEGQIVVRRAKEGEKFLGLDDKERILTKENLVIADKEKVIALAGVIGGKNSEVDENTQNILLEAAIFSPLTVRYSRRAAAVNTESSYRFERAVFGEVLNGSSSEAAEMICNLAKGKFVGFKKQGCEPQRKQKSIFVSSEKLNDYVGQEIDIDIVKEILFNIGCIFEKEEKDSIGKVMPPPLRLDMEYDVDLFEEITRLYGYDKIEPKLPFIETRVERDVLYETKKLLRNFCSNLGLYETITFSLTSDKTLEKLQEKDFISLTNPLRSQENVMRTTLLPGAMEAVKYNLNQKNSPIKLFEIADIYWKNQKETKESCMLSMTVSDKAKSFFFLKAAVENILKLFNINEYSFKAEERNNLLNCLTVKSNGKELGYLGKVNKDVQEFFECEEEVFYCQLNINELAAEKQEKKYQPFSRYPAAFRDISFLIEKKSKTKFSDLEKIIITTVKNNLSDYKIIDEYKPKNSSEVIYTLRVSYQSKEQTLTSQEVEAINVKLRQSFTKLNGVVLR